MALITIEEWCLSNDLDQSIKVAQTLKVLETIAAEDQHSAPSRTQSTLNKILPLPFLPSADKRFAIKQSRKFVSMALSRFTEQLKQNLRLNVERDNCGELNKILTIYQQLDKLGEGVQEYLTSVIR